MPEAWIPETGSDRRLIQQELRAILASPHFKNSKRYPALLQHVVEKSLDGQTDHLKERTLGVEVFGRQPDYHTNGDPVVRVSAGEVRKRIALYYHEASRESEIQIELPVGSYTPEFRKRFIRSESTQYRGPESIPEPDDVLDPHLVDDADRKAELTVAETYQELPRKWRQIPWALSIGLLLCLVSLAVYFVHRGSSSNQLNQLWAPLVQTQDPVLIVIGCGKPWLILPESTETSLSDHMIGTYHRVSVQDTVAVSHLANILQKQNRNYFIKEASSTSLADIRGRTIILVGALSTTVVDK
jgi:tetrahydromethanopterin S-methyltransferase subunit G